MPEVEVKDHPEDLCTFELHSPAGASGYPITLVAHKDPVKKYWLKEIREYASDQVALAEHAADDLQLSEVPDTSEDQKDRVKPEGAKIEPPKSKPEESKSKTEVPKAVSARPEATKPVGKPEVAKEPEVAKPVAKEPEVTKPEAAKSSAKPEVAKPVVKPEVTKSTAKPEAPKIPEVAETKTTDKRRDSRTKTEETINKKIKTEEEMSGQFSASSRVSASTRVVEGEFYLFTTFHIIYPATKSIIYQNIFPIGTKFMNNIHHQIHFHSSRTNRNIQMAFYMDVQICSLSLSVFPLS